jgi:hypothetical protein
VHRASIRNSPARRRRPSLLSASTKGCLIARPGEGGEKEFIRPTASTRGCLIARPGEGGDKEFIRDFFLNKMFFVYQKANFKNLIHINTISIFSKKSLKKIFRFSVMFLVLGSFLSLFLSVQFIQIYPVPLSLIITICMCQLTNICLHSFHSSNYIPINICLHSFHSSIFQLIFVSTASILRPSALTLV